MEKKDFLLTPGSIQLITKEELESNPSGLNLGQRLLEEQAKLVIQTLGCNCAVPSHNLDGDLSFKVRQCPVCMEEINKIFGIEE
jgi:hypothetical protein